MKKLSKWLLIVGMTTLVIPSFAQDIGSDAVLACKAKGIKLLENCPEYNEAIKQLQSIMSNAANDPRIKAKNKAAFDEAIDMVGVNKNN